MHGLSYIIADPHSRIQLHFVGPQLTQTVARRKHGLVLLLLSGPATIFVYSKRNLCII